jgi:ABC-type multidrug transport system ATPase subunit
VDENEIFGFIGPDGAGKTTLFRIITTLLLPDSGNLKIMGMDAEASFRELRKNIGYMPGRFSLYHDLTVEENLDFYATVFGTTVKENYMLIEDIYTHIEPFRKRLAGKLSGGMKQKLALSCALIHKPRLLVLDEPTTGVDAVSRAEFWTMLEKLRHFNITIIVSTPYMDEASRCNRVALMQSGRIISLDTPENIRRDFSRKLYAVRSSERYRLLTALRRFSGTESAWPFGQNVHLTLKEGAGPGNVLAYLEEEGIEDAVLEEKEPVIEDRFLELTESGARA